MLLSLCSAAAAAVESIASFDLLRTLDPGAASDAGEDLAVRIAHDASGTWIAVWQSRGAAGQDFDVLVARSTDGGLGWSAPTPISARAASDVGDDVDPAIATDEAGHWVVVWSSTDPAGGLGTDADIRIARSTDGGLSWTPDAALVAAAGGDDLLDEKPWVAADASGRWLVAWQREDPTQTLLTDFDVVVARSADAGATWDAPLPITANAASDERPDTAVRLLASAGTWIALWQMDDRTDDVKSDADVAVARSVDGGASWSAPVLLNPNAADGPRDDMSPYLATDGQGRWVAVWQSNDAITTLGEDFDILSARSSDDGVSWSAPVAVNRQAPVDRAADLDPQVASDGPGRFVAVWQSSAAIGATDNAFHVRLARSADGGASWTPSQELAPKPTDGSSGEFDPQLEADASGSFVMASYHFGGFGSDTDVVLSRATQPFGPSAALDPAAAGDARTDLQPAVAALGPGRWVAAWSSSGPGSALGSDADLLVSWTADTGRTWSTPAPLNSAASGDALEDVSVQLACGATSCVAVWQVTDPNGVLGADGDVFVARSDDGGASFGPQLALAPDAATDARQESPPRIASDGAGRFVAVWQSTDPGGPQGTDPHVRVARSTDGGTSWSVPAPMHASAAGDGVRDYAPWVASDGSGLWLAAWRASDPAGGPGAFDVRVSRSTDAGATWSPPVVLDVPGDGVSAGEPRIASDGPGRWLVVWPASGGALGADLDLLAARSSDGGLVWSAPAPVEADASSDAGSDDAPQLANDGAGTTYVVWSSTDPTGGIGSDADLLTARSRDGGATWSDPTPLNGQPAHDSGADLWPQLASDGAGGWLAAWTSNEPLGNLGGDMDVLVAHAVGPDTDDDGIADAAEMRLNGTDPVDPDSDGDGLRDGEEIVIHGSDPLDGDSDGDLLSDYDEVFTYGADPTSTDGDGDGLGDWDEVNVHGSDPLDADSDGDGLGDYDEIMVYGTRPTDRDSDNDGWDDRQEILFGSDPNDASSLPATVPLLGWPATLALALALLGAARRAVPRPRRIALGLPLLLATALAPHAVRAIDPALCADDGVTEVPPFALGRDAQQCLLLDPGGGRPPVQIQYEVFHRRGISESATKNPQNPAIDVIDLRADAYGRCRTRTQGQYCTQLVWDVEIDNYLDPAVKNDDIWYSSKGDAFQYLLVKDTRLYNGWKCQGGAGWSGPNGLHCPAGEDSNAHSDGVQIRGEPVNGGWIVMQDSELVNAHNALLRVQAAPDFPPTGSLAFQGFRIGQSNDPTGEAKSWIDDCLARGAPADICYENNIAVGYQAQELWLIDVRGSTSFGGFDQIGKIVVVNTGCGTTGCNGRIGYHNGWPHPLSVRSQQGPSQCPDGLLVATPPWPGVGAVYCYTSLEKAAQSHALPPFVQLSPAGWENPPSP